jgi:ubiquinone/menaquinone biosynthesis C-methylase UbiE
VSPQASPAERLDAKTANILYHDAAARAYDDKWAISFDERSMSYVRQRAEWMLPERRYRRVLEVGAGTGFFLLNMWQAGFVEEAHACDISAGMLRVLGESARRLGLEVELRAADAERLPYRPGEFDLVVGHAFLHHLPDPSAALREAFRVLAPGGAILFAGEPTAAGDRIAGFAKRAAGAGFRLFARLRPDIAGQAPSPPRTDDERALRDLEFAVDLHTFEPADLERWATQSGFTRVRTETEELLASLFGWSVRTVESQVRPGLLGERWASFAYRTWLALYGFDRRVLYPPVPKRLFYNVLLYAEKPIA